MWWNPDQNKQIKITLCSVIWFHLCRRIKESAIFMYFFVCFLNVRKLSRFVSFLVQFNSNWKGHMARIMHKTPFLKDKCWFVKNWMFSHYSTRRNLRIFNKGLRPMSRDEMRKNPILKQCQHLIAFKKTSLKCLKDEWCSLCVASNLNIT